MREEVCEACNDLGWLEVSIDGNEAPKGMVYVQRCDLCMKYENDWDAAVARLNTQWKGILGVLCRNDRAIGQEERECDGQVSAKPL